MRERRSPEYFHNVAGDEFDDHDTVDFNVNVDFL